MQISLNKRGAKSHGHWHHVSRSRRVSKNLTWCFCTFISSQGVECASTVSHWRPYIRSLKRSLFPLQTSFGYPKTAWQYSLSLLRARSSLVMIVLSRGSKEWFQVLQQANLSVLHSVALATQTLQHSHTQSAGPPPVPFAPSLFLAICSVGREGHSLRTHSSWPLLTP